MPGQNEPNGPLRSLISADDVSRPDMPQLPDCVSSLSRANARRPFPVLPEGRRPSDSPTRALGRRFAGSLPPPLKLRRDLAEALRAKAGRARGSLRPLARDRDRRFVR